MRKPILVSIILTVVVVLVVLALVMLARIGASGAIAEKQTFQVSNPDYIGNPSGYLVDYDNKVSSIAPAKHGLWVENIVNDEKITVSYTIEKAGAKILDFQDIYITGIGYPAGKLGPDSYGSWYETPQGKCWIEGRTAYLRQNLLHKTVFIVDAVRNSNGELSGYRLLVELEPQGAVYDESPQDVAKMLISNGYGSLLPLNHRYDYTFFPLKDIQDIEEVASLQKRGLWGTCKAS